jgi:hypothetical protein
MPRPKLYAHVDETGQETQGKLFLVAVVLCGPDKERLDQYLLQVEATSGKGRKWHRSSFATRLAYLSAVPSFPLLRGAIHSGTYRDTHDYVESTIDATARALTSQPPSRLTVIVDGLKRREVHRFASGLRSRGIPVHKVRGLREEADSILRLADAMAGFLRDLEERAPYALELAHEVGLEAVIVRQ